MCQTVRRGVNTVCVTLRLVSEGLAGDKGLTPAASFTLLFPKCTAGP